MIMTCVLEVGCSRFSCPLPGYVTTQVIFRIRLISTFATSELYKSILLYSTAVPRRSTRRPTCGSRSASCERRRPASRPSASCGSNRPSWAPNRCALACSPPTHGTKPLLYCHQHSENMCTRCPIRRLLHKAWAEAAECGNGKCYSVASDGSSAVCVQLRLLDKCNLSVILPVSVLIFGRAPAASTLAHQYWAGRDGKLLSSSTYLICVQLDMERRDRERMAVKAAQLEEREAANLATRLQAEARIAAALQTNKNMLEKRRQEFDAKQEQNEERRRYGWELPLGCWGEWRGAAIPHAGEPAGCRHDEFCRHEEQPAGCRRFCIGLVCRILSRSHHPD